jgi:ubiquinone/menaquinone biosynthesis C-methylase UbiE
VGYVFRSEDTKRYDDWFQSEPGRTAWKIETELFSGLWAPVSRQNVLEVGCGTGHFLEWICQQGHQATGLEPSPSMRELARSRLPGCVTVDHGHAEYLPYEDNSFDTVALINTLEFVDDPTEALQEAVRVARRHVLVGVLNRYSLAFMQHCLSRLWRPSFYDHAHYFSVFELEFLIQKILSGKVPVIWKTCFTFPLGALKYLHHLERSRFFTCHPFGYFIAMRIDLHYPLQTIQTPLFCDLSPRVGHVPFYGSCWLSSRGERSYVLNAAFKERFAGNRDGNLQGKVSFEGHS